jgi:DnaK suppressor protein
MTKTQIDEFRAILTAKHAELVRVSARRDGIAIERTPDLLDQLQFAADRELTTRSLELHSRSLRNVRAALDRIAEGNYGTCLECDEEISHKRLQAVPWATLCIACQERQDRTPRHRSASEEMFLREAA